MCQLTNENASNISEKETGQGLMGLWPDLQPKNYVCEIAMTTWPVRHSRLR